MATALNVKMDLPSYKAAHDLLAPGELRRAIYNAIKRGTSKERSQTRKIIRKQIPNVPAKDVNDVVTSDVSNEGTSVTGTVTVSHKPLPMIAFHPIVSKHSGVTVDYGNGPLHFRHLFKATMKNGHTGIFGRVRGIAGVSDKNQLPYGFTPLGQRVAGRRYGSQVLIQLPPGSRRRAFAAGSASGFVSRLPIKEAGAPSVYRIATVPETASIITKDFADTVDAELQGQIRRFLKLGKAEPIPGL